jgi:hypothetical protein
MKKKAVARAVLGACLLQLAAIPVSYSADWQPQLVLPASGARGPSDPIRIRLPAAALAVLDRLTLELDDFDVTALVTREGNDAVFTSPQPLPFGPHTLRLIENAPDGSIAERGVWEFDIRKTAMFREAEGRISSTLNIVQRIADDDLPQPEPKRTQGNGAAQLSGVIGDEGWRIKSNMDLLYNSQKALTPRQKDQLDMGRFLIQGEAGPVSAQAGHHSVAPDSLIMQAFNRRGVSLKGGRDTDYVNATAFMLRTQDIVGFQEGFGIGDANNRVDGATIVGRPFGDTLILSAMYLTGEGPSQSGAIGTGVAGDTLSTGGRAANVVADSRLLDKSLRLRGEYAKSEYDFDGLNTGNAEEKDNAYSALATYTPWKNKVANGAPMALQVGIENKEIGTFFKSPANPIGVTDRKATRGFGSFGWGGFNLQTSLGYETDNVNDIALLPRTESVQTVLSMTYTPTLNLAPSADPSQPPALPWFGQPTFGMTYLGLDQDVTKAGAGLSEGAFHETQNLTAIASFTYQTWMWSANHSIGKDTDFTNVADDTETSTTQLAASVRVGEKLTIGPSVQFSQVDNITTPSLSSETYTALLNVGYIFTQRVNANVSYSVNRQKVDNNSVDTRSHDLIGALNWIVTPAQGMQPGFTVSLEGQYHDVDDRVITTNNQNNYQIFLKGSLSWMPVF